MFIFNRYGYNGIICFITERIDDMKNKKTLIIIIAVAAVAVLACILIPIIANKNKDNNDESGKNGESGSETTEQKKTDTKTMLKVGSEKDKLTYLDYEGNVKTLKFKDASDFFYGVTDAKNKDYEEAIIDVNGKEIVKFGEYDSIDGIHKTKNGHWFYATDKDNKTGVLDKDGKLVVKCKYAEIDELKDDDYLVGFLAKAEEDSTEMAVLSLSGEEIGTTTNYNIDVTTKESASDGTVYAYLKDKHDSDSTIYYLNLDTKKLIKKFDTDDTSVYNFNANAIINDNKITFYDKDGNSKKNVTLEDISAQFKDKPDLSDATLFVTQLCKDAVLVKAQVGSDNYCVVYDNNFKIIHVNNDSVIPLMEGKIATHFISYDNRLENICDNKGKKVMSCGEYSFEMYAGVIDRNVTQDVACPFKDYSGKTIRKSVKRLGSYSRALLDTEKDKYVLYQENSDKYVEAPSNYDYDGDLTGGYVLLRSKDKMKIMNFSTGKTTFEFKTSDFVSNLEEIKVVKLKDGYYNFNGEKVYSVDK